MNIAWNITLSEPVASVVADEIKSEVQAITGARFLYNPDDAATVTTRDDNGVVRLAALQDALGNEATLVQATEAEQPIVFTLSTGRKAITRTASDQSVVSALNSALNPPYTLVIVGRGVNSAAGAAFYLDSDGPSNRVIFGTNNEFWGVVFVNNDQNFSNNSASGSAAISDQPNFTTSYYNMNSGDMEFYEDGTLTDTSTSDAAPLESVKLLGADILDLSLCLAIAFEGEKTPADLADLLAVIEANYPIGENETAVPGAMAAPTATNGTEEVDFTLAAAPAVGGGPITEYTLEVDIEGGDFSSPVETVTQTPANRGNAITVALPPGRYIARSYATNSLGNADPSSSSDVATSFTNVTSEATGTMMSSITIDGETVNLAGSFEVGQSATGEYWLYNPTNEVTDIVASTSTPSTTVNGTLIGGEPYSNRVVHGAMVNPGSPEKVGTDLTSLLARQGNVQGWDTGVGSANGATYSGSMNDELLAAGGPVRMREGTYLKAISNLTPTQANGRGGVLKYIKLVVLTQRPWTDSLFGQPWTTGQALKHRKSDIDMTKLANNAAPSGQTLPSIQNRINVLSGVERQYHITNMDLGRVHWPTLVGDDGLGYGGQDGFGRSRGDTLQVLTMDYDAADKLELASHVVEEGIALSQRVMSGGVFPANGGLHLGRLPLLAATAVLLDDAEMLSMVDASGSYGSYTNRQRWHEEGNYFTVTQASVYDRVELENIVGTMPDVTGTSGYQVDDIIRFNGISYNGEQNTYRVDSVDGNGKILTFTQTLNTQYHVMPTGVVNVVGTGTGATTGIDRNTRILHDGVVGEIVWAGNYVAPSQTGPINYHLFDAYYYNVRRGVYSAFNALRNITGAVAAINGDDIFEYHDRMRYQAETPLSVDIVPDFDKAYYDDHVGYTDPQPGNPVVVETACNRNVVWVKYNKYLFDRDLNLTDTNFTVSINGGANVVVEAVMLGKIVSLYLSEFADEDEPVLVSYAKTSGILVEDWFGNEAPAFTDVAADNRTIDFVDPVPNSLVPNPSYQSDTSWSIAAGAGEITTDAQGERVFRMFASAGVGNPLEGDPFDITAGTTYQFRFNAKRVDGPTDLLYQIVWRDNSFAVIDSDDVHPRYGSLSEGIYGPVNRTAPAGATRANIFIRKTSGHTVDFAWHDVVVAP